MKLKDYLYTTQISTKRAFVKCRETKDETSN
jgi:hypothetical protein